MKLFFRQSLWLLLLAGISVLAPGSSVIAQSNIIVTKDSLKVPLDLKPEQLVPGTKIAVVVQNMSMPVACSGAGNLPVGGFSLCADQTNATPNLDRNNWWICCAPANWLPSEAYEFNFPSVASQFPCVTGVTVDQLILTITINSVTFNAASPYACCENYLEGLFANLYDNCPTTSSCPVVGDGLKNVSNPGTGDCSPSGDNLNYNGTTNSFPLGIPFTSTTTCLGAIIGTNDALGVDIVPSFRYDQAAANGCNCPQDLISQGLITIDYDLKVEYVFCSNSLPSGCYPATFAQVGPLCASGPSVTLPTTSSNGYSGTWNPPTINPAGQGGTTISAVFTPNAGQCIGGTSQMQVAVTAAAVPMFNAIGPLCENSPPVALPTTSTNGVAGTWNVGSTFNPSGQGGNTVPLTFTPNAGLCANQATLNVQVNASVAPSFSPIGPLCANSPPVALPTTSTNGVAGTWNVGSTFNPSGQGGSTVTLTFTPNAGLCASQATLNIQVNAVVAPSFSPIGPLCENVPPVALPTTSTNGVAGTWNVGPSFNPSGQGGSTVTLTFTPNAGLCASQATLNIQVNNEVAPSFSPIGPLCANSPPVALPSTSLNGVAGTWNVGPTFNPSGQGGSTVNLIFTPNAGQCASVAIVNIVVQQEATPSFSPIGPLCESAPPVALPSTSLNGITGTWNVGSTFNPNGQGGSTVNLTFIPNAGQCASVAILSIVVQQAATPSFTPIGSLCESAPPVALPSTSLNGITGTWNVGPTFNPNGQGGSTVNLTFIPNAGQCASVAILSIVVQQAATPFFSPIGPLCESAPPVALPSTSLNGITGTWNVGTSFNPAGLGGTVSNLAFSPGAGQCAVGVSVSILVNEPPQSTLQEVACNADLITYFVDFQTNGNNVSSTVGTVVANGSGNFTISNVPEGTNITVTVTNTTTGCTSTFNVTSPSCSCPAIAPPSGADEVICENEALPTLMVTTGAGLQVDWYNAPTAGVLLQANSTGYVPSGAGVFYAEAVDPSTNCTSNIRAAVELTILAVDTNYVALTTCDVSLTGVDTTVFATNECDSVVITTTTLLPGDEIFLVSTSCNPAEVGTDTLFLMNQAGCDSLVVTTTTLSPADTSFASATTCDPSLVGLDTLVFATPTCDSVVITTTTLLPSDVSFLMATSCNQADVGLDTLILSNQLGCDSLIVTETVLLPLPPVFEQATTCDPSQVGVDTLVYSSSGCDSVVITTTTLLSDNVVFLNASSCDPSEIGSDTLSLTNQVGCDSLVITLTALSAADTTFANATTCDPSLVGLDTITYFTATCDSVVITTTLLLPPDISFLAATSCNMTEVGIDTLVLSNQAGCDSLLITTTTFFPLPPTFVQAGTCDPSMVGMVTTILSSSGCDSLVITTTTLSPSSIVFLMDSSCDPASVGIDTLILTNSAGCDSLVVTATALSQADTTYLSATTCDPSQVGVEIDVFPAQFCDSVVFTTTSLVLGNAVFLNGTTCDPLAVGVDTLFLTNQFGCDSLVVTSTVLDAIPPTFLQATTCLFSEVGVDTIVFSTAGCDSLVITSTTLLPGSEVTVQAATCFPSAVGTDTVLLVNQAGCDSLVITQTILAGGISDATISIVDPTCTEPFGSIAIENITGGEAPYLYSIDGGVSFTNSPLFTQLLEGNYAIVVEDANGCPFEATGQLTGVTGPGIILDPDQVDLNLGESYPLTPVLTIPDTLLETVQWTPSDYLDCQDCLLATATPLESTEYTITVVDKNGCGASAVILLVVNKQIMVYVPTVFSPDGNGINDIFTVMGDETAIAQVDRLLIFDRWGDYVFESSNFPVNDFSYGWDGTRKGRDMHQGVYVYLAEVTLANGEKLMLEGEILLVR